MQSCDNFALCPQCYAGGRTLLAKNSDRPLGECQPLRYFPARTYEKGEQLHCSITIPQVEQTYAMLGSQPWWIWGFEMGVNEWGLAIGNEAQWSRCEQEQEEGLLGMDLLRLGLERAKTARQAISVITELLERYGQNSNASTLYDRRYENSFLLVDPQEVWVLETAGRQWAAKQIRDWTAISNCYSLERDYELCSRELESYARQRRWLAPSQEFSFAQAYTRSDISQRNSVPRWRRLCKLVGGGEKPMDQAAVKAVLRDHFDGELIEPRFGPSFGTFVSICMHAMVWDGSQTAASMLFEYDPVLGVMARYAPSVPCCSAYIPVYLTGSLPGLLEKGSKTFDSESLWWNAEGLAAAVSVDEARFGPEVRKQMRALEQALEQEANQTQEQARALVTMGQREQGMALLAALTERSVEKLLCCIRDCHDRIREAVRQEGGLYGQRKEFLEAYCERVQMPLF